MTADDNSDAFTPGDLGPVDAEKITALTSIDPRMISDVSQHQDRAPHLTGLEASDRERVAAYVERASSPATLRAYRSDWAFFESWCAAEGYDPLPATPAVTAAFLTHLSDYGTERTQGRGLSRASIGRRLAAIVFAHRAADLLPPTAQVGSAVLEHAVRGIRRSKRADVSQRKRPADGDVLRDAMRAIEGDSLRSIRDRALLAVGMGGAFRRSELVGIDVAHITDSAEGLRILVPFAKTDQDGRGAIVVIPDRPRIAPVVLYRAWIEAAVIREGPVFRKLTPQGRLTDKAMSAHGVALVIKARVAAAGYDPAGYSGHSLRAGFLTEAGRQGASAFKMKDHC
jgi:site-specific recombinase XerD